ncbi:hypothetical protein J6590_059520 [Homalodisca vitripennis]|nr:hypothetical protein J6590_059520 [Homalodisca vitripennis]
MERRKGGVEDTVAGRISSTVDYHWSYAPRTDLLEYGGRIRGENPKGKKYREHHFQDGPRRRGSVFFTGCTFRKNLSESPTLVPLVTRCRTITYCRGGKRAVERRGGFADNSRPPTGLSVIRVQFGDNQGVVVKKVRCRMRFNRAPFYRQIKRFDLISALNHFLYRSDLFNGPDCRCVRHTWVTSLHRRHDGLLLRTDKTTDNLRKREILEAFRKTASSKPKVGHAPS